MECGVPGRCEFAPGDLLDGRYRVRQVLGEGTFGRVYRVEDERGETCAVKLLKLWEVAPGDRKNLLTRFEMEFETGRIQSDYLVHTRTHGEVERNPYIVMEFCPHGDWRTTHLANDPMRVSVEVLRGLRDLHAHGKIHRDLKPDNVLFRSDGRAALTDFGISGDQNKRMTERNWIGRPRQIFGTYAYMPPEQVRPPRGGKATVLPTTDLFSFGVMVFERLTGRLPFGLLEGEVDLMPYLERGRKGMWEKGILAALPDGVFWRRVIGGCLEPDYRERFQSAEEVLQLFEEERPDLKMAIGCRPEEPKYGNEAGWSLRVMQGEEYGRVYRLNELLSGRRRLLTLGRNAGEVRNDVEIREEESCYVSRRHCTLEWSGVEAGGQWYVRDGQWDPDATNGWCPSTNGTYVNASSAGMTEMPLREGDILSVGDVKLRVERY